MLGTTWPSKMLPPNEARDVLRDVAPHIRAADLAVGNLEGAMIDGGTSAKGSGKNSYSFRMHTRYGARLKEAGYDFLSMANNHARDFGMDGIASTEKVLDKEDIKYAGVQGRVESVVLEKNGVCYGIAAFGHNSYTVKHTDMEKVRAIVRELRVKSDIVIISMYGGTEGRDSATCRTARKPFWAKTGAICAPSRTCHRQRRRCDLWPRPAHGARGGGLQKPLHSLQPEQFRHAIRHEPHGRHRLCAAD